MFFKKIEQKNILSGKGRVGRGDLLRRRYKVGERIRGCVVKYLKGNRAWLDVDGQRFLAELEVVPPQGEEIEFLVLATAPKVVLKALGSPNNKVNILI